MLKKPKWQISEYRNSLLGPNPNPQYLLHIYMYIFLLVKNITYSLFFNYKIKIKVKKFINLIQKNRFVVNKLSITKYNISALEEYYLTKTTEKVEDNGSKIRGDIHV